ncbi:Thiol-disulfide oxidoreductase ResA [compost metagenome]
MKKRSSLIFALLLTTIASASTVTGHLKQASEWANTVYLSEMREYKFIFSGSSYSIVDSQRISERGIFKFEHLKPNTLYRVSARLVADDIPGIIEDGNRDNYAFVITGDQGNAVHIEADISRLWLSYAMLSSTATLADVNDKILYLRDLRKPIYAKMQSLDARPLHTLQDPDKIAEYQLSLVKEIKAVTESNNKLLLPFLLKETNANLLALAAGLYQIELANNKDNDLITAHLDNVEKSTPSNLLSTVLIVLQKSRKTIKPDFLFDRSYMLMEGKNFNFLSPRIPAKFILLDCWASWCSPCRKSIKTDLPYLSKKYTPQQLQIIGVVVKDKFQPAEKAIKADKNTYLQIYDQDKFLDEYFEIEGIPYYVLINQETQEIKAFQVLVDLEEYLAKEL